MAALTDARRLVVKIGSALLVDRASGTLRADWLLSLAADVARLRARGVQVVLVSSGSIALGRGVLGLPTGSPAAGAVAGRRRRRADPSWPAPMKRRWRPMASSPARCW